MTDDIPVTPGTGANVATDDVGGRHFQVVKLDVGGDGVSTPVVDGLPVVVTGTPPLPTGASTEATLADILAAAVQIQDGVQDLAGALTGDEPNRVLVEIAESTLPTGAATSAKQDTQITAEQAIQTAVQIMDDWDESDRAKVNPIVGQAGIAAGTGVDGATVPRVTLATNVGLPAGANNIGDVDVLTLPALVAGTANIGDVDVLTVPADPFGANADAAVAAGAAGSIQAKLRRLTTDLDTVNTSNTAIKTAVEIMDDWDESDRAKVNLVVGQAGVTAGAGSVAANTPRVTHASDDPVTTAVQLIDDTILADDVGFTPGTSKVSMIGLQADETGTDSVDEGDAGAPRMTLDRKQIVTPQPHSAGGLTTFMASGSDGSSILTNAAQVIKATAGSVYGWYIYNPNSSAIFVHFYNTAAASVTVGTTNPLFTLTIPATQAANILGAVGIAFTNAGFSIAATTTAGGNGAPATGLDANVFYA